MIVLALVTASAAFSVSYAKWEKATGNVSANGSTGLWDNGTSPAYPDNIYRDEVYISGNHFEIRNWTNQWGQQYVKYEFEANAGETVVIVAYKDDAPIDLEFGADTDPNAVTRKSRTEFVFAEKGNYAVIFNLDSGTMDIIFSSK